MSLELARLHVTIRADTSKLGSDMQRAKRMISGMGSGILSTTLRMITAPIGAIFSFATSTIKTVAGILIKIPIMIASAVKTAVGLIASVFSTLVQLASTALVAIKGFLVLLIKESLKLAAAYETTEAAFTVMTGSAKSATKLLRDLQELSRRSPFSFADLQTQARTIMAYGIENEKLIKTMKMLGEISSATGAQFNRLALAYGQVRSKGRLYMQEVRQFTEAGFPMLEILAQNLGTTSRAVQEMIRYGKISFADVEKAIARTTERGGKFFRMMEARAKTLGGTWIRLKDEISFALREIGLAIAPAAKEFMEMAIEWTRAFTDAKNGILKAIRSLGNEVFDWAKVIRYHWDAVWAFVSTVGQAWLVRIREFFAAFVRELPNLFDNIATTIVSIWKRMFEMLTRMGAEFFKGMSTLFTIQLFRALTGKTEKYNKHFIAELKHTIANIGDIAEEELVKMAPIGKTFADRLMGSLKSIGSPGNFLESSKLFEEARMLFETLQRFKWKFEMFRKLKSLIPGMPQFGKPGASEVPGEAEKGRFIGLAELNKAFMEEANSTEKFQRDMVDIGEEQVKKQVNIEKAVDRLTTKFLDNVKLLGALVPGND